MATRASRSLLEANRRLCGLPWPRRRNATIVSAFRSTGRMIGPSDSTWTGSRSLRLRLNPIRYAHSQSTDSAQRAWWKDSNVNTRETRPQTPSLPHWENQEMPALDLPIPTHVVSNFMGFACWGDLPNGKKTSLPLMQQEEGMLWMLPPAEWAPAPFNTGAEAVGAKIFLRATNHQGMERVSLVGKNIHAFKTYLMEGLVPLSEAQWRAKDLNNPDRLETAIEYITGVSAVFEYLSIPQVEANLRETFNLVYDDLEELGGALNARRRIHHPHRPDLDLPALWVEFMAARYEVMTSTAHAWMISKVAQLKEQLLDRFCAVAQLPPDQVTAEERGRLEQLWQLLTDITALADVGAWIFMDTYKGYRATPGAGIVPGLHNPDIDILAKAYQPRLGELSVSRLNEVIRAQTDAGTFDSAGSLRERVSATTYAQDKLRLEMRGPSPTEPLTPPWIDFLIRDEEEMQKMKPQEEKHTFGFAIYGAAGKLSDNQWEAVKQKVEDHVASWGEGIKGAGKVKPLLKLYWHDCKELGLDVNDVDSLKSHFRTARAADTSPLGIGIEETTFLVLDSWSVGSYTDATLSESYLKEKTYLPGDFQPHLLAVDAHYVADPEPPATVSEGQSNNTDAKSSDANKNDDFPTLFPQPPPPKYTGHMRILGNLIWSELYALVARNAATLEDLFPLALEHPQKLYTGLTVPSQIRAWREHTMLKNSMMESFAKYLAKKDPKAAEALRRAREKHAI
ncbi:hypothetical protein BJX68DRAFT_223360 [Aspergillus pseudodeflectus]|uniref:Uncharacterized protein n=1 Tax=Aspergillus pseudodeflectus TaxID=176178 RepID=A0ABR4LBB2_9EURO